ncbi:beta subunit of assimilatory sulfite reductase [Mucor ambiguus]|uniref:assimilatory sulfite reductase (NADPH) n=1 Tax=Mucor ambiguus TaxID=91626 RepID=A0A0C9M6E0_9FUNG|nr:beta subunit of assimilatory sulfite reductase [Mucor ambiguus]
MQFLNGREASTLVAQLTNERVYANVDTSVPQLTQTNIWNQAVKLHRIEDPVSHLTTAIARRQLSSAILSSQSLLAAIPYLYKLASDTSSVVLHVAADHKHSSPSFADFTQVMSVRQSGLALLSATCVQEAYDLALIAQAVSLKASTPFLHFFDSKRISNEYTSIQVLSKDVLLTLLPEKLVNEAFRNKAVPELVQQSAYLKYKASLLAQPKDEAEQHEEGTSLPLDVVAVFHQVADQFAELTGRHYAPLEYTGHPEAEHVIISMGAGANVVEQSLRAMIELDPFLKVGALKIRLYRPWNDRSLLNALPATVQRIAVLEPTDDYTSTYNPLFLDVAAAYQTANNDLVDIVSGQYGVQDTDFSPDMVQSVIRSLVNNNLDRRFEVSSLPRESVPLQVVPSGTEQVIFVSGPSLASSYAAQQIAQGKVAQVYALEGLDVTHVRVASSHVDPFLPSLVQSADAVVIVNLPLLREQEQATVDAIRALSHGGAILLDGDAAALPVCVKKAAHARQATIVSVRDFSVSVTKKSLSEILAHPDSVSTTAPDAWAGDRPQTLSVEPNVLKSNKKHMAILPVETPYLKMLDQVFGSRLVIANAYHASSVWSPDISHPHAASPEFGYGRIVNRSQERSRLADFVSQVIRSSSLPLEAVRVLSLWLMLVNSRQSSVSKVQDAADMVIRVLSSIAGEYPVAQSILDKKELLYTRSHWLVGSDMWAYDLGQSGLHHVMTSGDNVNILIVDTASYTSQTEREQQKKDIGLYAMNYGSVYVASVAVYASYTGVLQALMEADAYQGPSIVLAYLPQLYDVPHPLATLKETKASVDTGAWPLYRWNPALEEAAGQDMFSLDSQRIKKSLEAFLARENYLTQLVSSHPDISNALASSLESDVKKRHAELKAKARADYARLLSGLGSSNGPPLAVLFGSDNGNAEGVAKKIASRAKARGLQVKLMAMDDYEDVQELANETNLVLVCSSAGQGEMPSNAREFWKALNGLIVGDVSFTELNVAVFGLGDSHYWPREEDAIFYNRPGKLLDAKLENLGATRLVALGLGDDQDEDGFETALGVWQPELWRALGVKDVGANDEEPPYTDDQMKIDSNYLRGNISAELVDDATGSVSEITQKLMKFHGAYVQDDRDLRDERKKQGLEKAYSFLIRVRTPGGVSTSAQWLAMDTLSTKYGNNTMKLTTRQAFQLHGVLKKNLRTTVRRINKALLSTLAACGDVNRNIMSTAVTEIPEVHAQVQELVIQLCGLLAPKTNAYHEIWLDNSMVAGHAVQDFEPLYGPSYLPRKFKMVIAVPPNNDVDVYAHDLGLIAIVDPKTKTVLGYNVLIGGGMGQTHGNKKTYPRPASPIGYIPADAVLKVAEAVVTTQRDHGDRVNRKHARFKYTVDDMGVEAVKKKIEARSGVTFEKERPYTFKDNYDRYGWTRGVAGTWNFGMFIENGRVKDTPDFLCKTGLRELAKFHKGEFRLTANQHLVIANVPEADLEKTKAHLAKYKLDNLSFTGIRKSAMACVALPTCSLAMAESERYLPELITLLEQTMEEAGLADDSIVVRMTGCPNGCARPYLAELAFVGKAPGTYNMYLGGNNKGERLNKIYRENLMEQDILNEVRPMIKRFALEREEGESFGDWVIRVGYVKKTITGLDFHSTD